MDGRVKFSTEALGPFIPDEKAADALLRLLDFLEKSGLAPILEDGGVAGNAAIFSQNGMLVSRSNRARGTFSIEDIVLLRDFDQENWHCSYHTLNAEYKPTSDTPLHFLVLKESQKIAGWEKAPRFSLHGHAAASEADARKISAPISAVETTFSTREDFDALAELLRSFPYPQYNTWIRRGHGFITVGETEEEVIKNAEKILSTISS